MVATDDVPAHSVESLGRSIPCRCECCLVQAKERVRQRRIVPLLLGPLIERSFAFRRVQPRGGDRGRQGARRRTDRRRRIARTPWMATSNGASRDGGPSRRHGAAGRSGGSHGTSAAARAENLRRWHSWEIDRDSLRSGTLLVELARARSVSLAIAEGRGRYPGDVAGRVEYELDQHATLAAYDALVRIAVATGSADACFGSLRTSLPCREPLIGGGEGPTVERREDRLAYSVTARSPTGVEHWEYEVTPHDLEMLLTDPGRREMLATILRGALENPDPKNESRIGQRDFAVLARRVLHAPLAKSLD